MKGKFYRYIFQDYDTTAGMINADNEKEAMTILQNNYPNVNFIEDCEFFRLIEVDFSEGICEVYYGS